MKLTLRPEWRLRPLSSALGFLDLKTAVIISLLFAVLNKVAGIYGLVAVLTGAGGSAAQLSLYIYSVVGLVALGWGLKAISQENPKQSLYFAHLFFADHVVSTAWLVFFAVVWWVSTPHDGRRQANSPAQEEIRNSGPQHSAVHNMTEAERELAAMTIWGEEKGLSAAVITLGWVVKFYFAALIYSYAIHLRKGSYRSLPLSRPSPTLSAAPLGMLPDEDEDDVEDFYRLPVRAPPPHVQAHSRQSSQSHHGPANSLSSFADFVSAPGRTRRGQPGKSNLGIGVGNGLPNGNGYQNGVGNGNGHAKDGDEVDEVLFDEDELSARRVGRSVEGSTSGDSVEGTQSRSTSNSRRPSWNAAAGRG